MSFKKATAAYSVAHFVVDFSCAFLIYNYLHGSSQWIMCLLAYNFFAFAMQLPLGIVSDFTGKSSRFAALGCILVALSPLFRGLPLALCVFAGLGNGLFHIGAGRDVLSHSGGRYALLGVFVSPGAVGLYLGTIAGGQALISPLIPAVLLVLSAVVIFILTGGKKPDEADKPKTRLQKPGLFAVLALLCLFLVVCLRSYVGMTLAFPWKGEGDWSLYLLLALALGKAFGGFLADWLGATEAALMSLLAAAIFFALYQEPVCGILAVFFFNMSMPITLGAAGRLLPEAKGFGFGLLTFGLFVGFLPVIMQLKNVLTLPWGFCAASALSAILLFIGLGGKRRLHAPDAIGSTEKS